MGLDIAAYSKLKRVEFQDGLSDIEDDDLPEGVVRLYTNDIFPGRADQIVDGCYEYGDCHCFHVGSYNWYTEWRDDLVELAGYHKKPADIKAGEGPFSELIDFCSAEGVIGVTHCRRLFRDFYEFQDKAESSAFKIDAYESERFCKLYRQWLMAFRLASDDGAVYFH